MPGAHAGPRTSLPREAAVLGPLVVATLVGLEYAAREQAGHVAITRAVIAVLLTQVLPGALLWRAVRPRTGWLVEDVAIGAVLGAALGVVGQVARLVLGVDALSWLLPVAVGLAVLGAPGPRRRALGAGWAPLPWWWGAAAALVLVRGFQIALSLFHQPIPDGRPWTAQYVDLSYHLALAGELSHRFPPHSPQAADQLLNYHWFAHAWMAQVGAVSGTELDVVLLRFMPVYLGVLVPLAIAVAALRVLRSPVGGPLAALASLTVGQVAFWQGSRTLPMTPVSPTLGFSVLVTIGAVTLLAARWRGETAGRGLLVLALLELVAFGAKGSAGPVVLVGCVVATVVVVLARAPHRGIVLLDTVVAVVALGLVFTVLFAGNEGGMTTAPLTSQGLRQAPLLGASTTPGTPLLVLLTVLVAVATVLPWLGTFGFLADRARRTDPVLWLCAGTGAGGIGATMVLHHPSTSEMYFLDSAMPLLALGTAGGLIALADVVRRRASGRAGRAAGLLLGLVVGLLAGLAVARGYRPADQTSVTRSLLSVVLALAVVGVVVVLGRLLLPGRGWAGGWLAGLLALVVLGGVPALDNVFAGPYSATPLAAGPNEPDSVGAGQVAAARWIRDHSGADDLVMTDRHCRLIFAPRCDDRRFYLAAYSERRVLIESWGYTRRTNESGAGDPTFSSSYAAYWDPALLALNDGFYRHPTAAEARSLWQRGVRWVYVEKLLPHVPLAPYARAVFDDRDALVYRLLDPAGVRNG